MRLPVRILLILSATAALTVAQGDDEELVIVPGDKEITRAVGQSLLITCQVTGHTQEDAQLSWINPNGETIDETAGRVYVEEDGKRELKLYITDIISTDSGEYTCRGRASGAQVEDSRKLFIFKDITFDHWPTPQHPRLYDNALIECEVSGQPAPKVSWRFKGMKVEQGGRYTYEKKGLRIENITEEDNGQYTCRAEVPADGRYGEKNIIVEVHIPPKITQPMRDSEGIEDQEVAIECKADGKPPPKYDFYKDGSEAPLSSMDDRVIVDRNSGVVSYRPLKKIDEGTYKCKAINDVGDVVSEGFLKVVVPPRINDIVNETAREGASQTLRCITEADPAPEMTFTKVKTGFTYEHGANEAGRITVATPTPGELTLTINNLNPQDTSNYTCHAKNKGGEQRKNGTITVHFAPSFADHHITEVYSWAGKTKNITCTALGEPEPVIEWYRYGRRLETNETYTVYQMGRNGALQVKIRDEDQDWIYGFYNCKAINDLGNKELPIELQQATVPGKPKSVDVQEHSPTMLIFTVLPPEDNGGVEIYGYRVEYDKKIQDFQVGEEIKIENLKPSTSYIFQFRAKNEVGVGVPLEHAVTMEDIRKPYPIHIISDPEGKYTHNYVLRWEKPRTGGLPIERYEIRTRRVQVHSDNSVDKPLDDWNFNLVQDNEAEPLRFYDLGNLKSGTHYEVKIQAENQKGLSDPTFFVFWTAKEPGAVTGGSPASKGCTMLLTIAVVTTLVQALLCLQ